MLGREAPVALAAPQGRATARVPTNREPASHAVACSSLESDLFQGITVRVSIQIVQEPPLEYQLPSQRGHRALCRVAQV